MEVAKEKRRAVQKRDNNHRLYIFPENLFMYIQFLTKTYFSILSLAFPLPYDIYSKKKIPLFKSHNSLHSKPFSIVDTLFSVQISLNVLA
jgi:hypothetical protein